MVLPKTPYSPRHNAQTELDFTSCLYPHISILHLIVLASPRELHNDWINCIECFDVDSCILIGHSRVRSNTHIQYYQLHDQFTVRISSQGGLHSDFVVTFPKQAG